MIHKFARYVKRTCIVSRIQGQEYHVPKVTGSACGCKIEWKRVPENQSEGTEEKAMRRRVEVPLSAKVERHPALAADLWGRPMADAEYDVEDRIGNLLTVADYLDNTAHDLASFEDSLLSSSGLTDRTRYVTDLFLRCDDDGAPQTSTALAAGLTEGRISQLLKASKSRAEERHEAPVSLHDWRERRSAERVLREALDESTARS